MARRVAVVGAGSSGLACIKVCVDEGLEPICFESSHDIGGLWRLKESPEPERANIYRSLVVNTSKEMMCFSDFPMPGHYPNYMHNSQLLQYFRLYAEHFDLLRYIHFQTTVKAVTQRPDFSVSGQWNVVTINRDGEEESHVFDAVLVCSGHFVHPALPLSHFPGHETFSGKCLHSWEYKDADAFRGKRVVVVGIGNSGGDIAVEISRSAENTFLSMRGGAWLISRMSSQGLPLDMSSISRFNNILMDLLPRNLVSWAIERSLNQQWDHRLYGLRPKHRVLGGRILINDELPGQLLKGMLALRPNLRAFKDSGVVFEDGTVEDNIDAVVFCTGYIESFPFLQPDLFAGQHRELTLYKRLFPPSLSQPTLAVMGLLQTKGPIMPVVEMQARWAVKVFTGLSCLPSKKQMQEDIESDLKRNMKRYVNRRQAVIEVDYITYLDFMAKEVGVRPNLLRLLLTDPVLWVKVLFGPCTPYQYRLTGPGRWAGARQAILSQWDRMVQPLRTRVVPEPDSRPSFFPSSYLLICGGTAVAAVLLSGNEIEPLVQGAAQFLDGCKCFLKESWLSGLITKTS